MNRSSFYRKQKASTIERPIANRKKKVIGNEKGRDAKRGENAMYGHGMEQPPVRRQVLRHRPAKDDDSDEADRPVKATYLQSRRLFESLIPKIPVQVEKRQNQTGRRKKAKSPKRYSKYGWYNNADDPSDRSEDENPRADTEKQDRQSRKKPTNQRSNVQYPFGRREAEIPESESTAMEVHDDNESSEMRNFNHFNTAIKPHVKPLSKPVLFMPGGQIYQFSYPMIPTNQVPVKSPVKRRSFPTTYVSPNAKNNQKKSKATLSAFSYDINRQTFVHHQKKSSVQVEDDGDDGMSGHNRIRLGSSYRPAPSAALGSEHQARLSPPSGLFNPFDTSTRRDRAPSPDGWHYDDDSMDSVKMDSAKKGHITQFMSEVRTKANQFYEHTMPNALPNEVFNCSFATKRDRLVALAESNGVPLSRQYLEDMLEARARGQEPPKTHPAKETKVPLTDDEYEGEEGLGPYYY